MHLNVSVRLFSPSHVSLSNPVVCLRSRSVEESFNMSDESSGPSLGVARKKKIAIGVIFLLSPNEEENAKFQDFFFSHFPLFESHMNKLKSAIEQVRCDLCFCGLQSLCVICCVSLTLCVCGSLFV